MTLGPGRRRGGHHGQKIVDMQRPTQLPGADGDHLEERVHAVGRGKARPGHGAVEVPAPQHALVHAPIDPGAVLRTGFEGRAHFLGGKPCRAGVDPLGQQFGEALVG